MKRGYYLTFGVNDDDIELIVRKIQKLFDIELRKGDDLYNEELYILLNSGSKFNFSTFSILNNYGNSFFTDVEEIVNIKYLISCNITEGDENKKFSDAMEAQSRLEQMENVRKLNYDIDEWE